MPRPSYLLFPTRDLINVTDGIVNPTGTRYSEKVLVGDDRQISLTLETTGTLAGTLTLWYSNKMEPNEATDADWDQDTVVSIVNPGGSATKQRIEIGNIGARFVRVKYVHSSGTGTLSGRAVS